MTKKENIKAVSVEVSTKERDKFLEELVFNGFATYQTSILDGKINIELKSLSGDDQLSLDTKVADIDASPVKVMHSHTIWLLTFALTKFGDTNLTLMSEKEKFDFIKSKSSVIIDLISNEHNTFHKKLQASVVGEAIEEVFLESPPTS